MFATGSGAACPSCSGCAVLRPPKASLTRAGRAAPLCSDVCSAPAAAAGRRKETRGEEQGGPSAPSWWRSVGSTDAWPERLAGDKSMKKRGCLPRRGAHTFPSAGLSRGDIRKPCCRWSEQRLSLSHANCMRQWDAAVSSGNGRKQRGRLRWRVAMARVQTGGLGPG